MRSVKSLICAGLTVCPSIGWALQHTVPLSPGEKTAFGREYKQIAASKPAVAAPVPARPAPAPTYAPGGHAIIPTAPAAPVQRPATSPSYSSPNSPGYTNSPGPAASPTGPTFSPSFATPSQAPARPNVTSPTSPSSTAAPSSLLNAPTYAPGGHAIVPTAPAFSSSSSAPSTSSTVSRPAPTTQSTTVRSVAPPNPTSTDSTTRTTVFPTSPNTTVATPIAPTIGAIPPPTPGRPQITPIIPSTQQTKTFTAPAPSVAPAIVPTTPNRVQLTPIAPTVPKPSQTSSTPTYAPGGHAIVPAVPTSAAAPSTSLSRPTTSLKPSNAVQPIPTATPSKSVTAPPPKTQSTTLASWTIAPSVKQTLSAGPPNLSVTNASATKDGYIIPKNSALIGSDAQQCAVLVQALRPDVGKTSDWNKGAPVTAYTAPGTPIATFATTTTPTVGIGRYPTSGYFDTAGKNPAHSAIVVGPAPNRGLKVLEQYAGKPAQVVPWSATKLQRYSTIVTASP